MTSVPNALVPARGVRQPSRRKEDDGPARRRADAHLVLASLKATREWEQATGRRSAVKPLRELLWYVWEAPRLPGPLYRGKYPLSAPWTPAARAAYNQPGGRVALEHVLPSAVLVRRLLDSPPATPASLVRILNTITYVVITPEDNKRLNAAGVGSNLADGSSDPWERYRVSGLDPSTFAPIEPGT